MTKSLNDYLCACSSFPRMLIDGFTMAGSAKTGCASQREMDNPEDLVSAEGVEQQAEKTDKAEETIQKQKKARKARKGKNKRRIVEEELLEEEEEPYDKQ